ncbi:MAG TPA: hypothetical protein P5543_00800 [Planctomycetota bacterium]|nr:hypothetical protein [Planctomycetota bacterium]
MGDWTFMFFKVMLIPIIAMVVGLQGIYKPPSQDSLDRGLLYTPKMNDEKWNASCKHYGKIIVDCRKDFIHFFSFTYALYMLVRCQYYCNSKRVSDISPDFIYRRRFSLWRHILGKNI